MTDKQKKDVMVRQKGKVFCQGCGKELRPDDDLSGTECAKTKRGDWWFFHTGCMNGVWKRKIRWEEKENVRKADHAGRGIKTGSQWK